MNLSQLVGALTSGYSSVCTGASPLLLRPFYDEASCVNLSQLVGTGAWPLLLHPFYDAASCVKLGQLVGALMGGYSGAVHRGLASIITSIL